MVYYLDMEKKKYSNSELYRVYDYSISNKEELTRSVSCGCFSCETLLMANDIRDWMEEDGKLTAVCPYCGKPTIGDCNLYPLKKEFLREMKKFWNEKTRSS